MGLFGLKRRSAYIAITISTILIVAGIVFAIIYGRPKSWKQSTEYVDGIYFGEVQMISSDGSTLAVIESGGSGPYSLDTIRSVQIIPTVSSNDDRTEAVHLSPFIVEEDDDYPLPANSEFRNDFDPNSPFYFDPITTDYDLSISGDGTTLVVFGLAFMFDNYRAGLGYHALCNTTAVDVTDRYNGIGLHECMYSRVTAYKRISSSSNEWERVGPPIEHVMKRDISADVETDRRRGISLSNDGETLAIRYVGGIDIYNLRNGMWKQIGDSILVDGRLGRSSSLNADGTRVATGDGAVYEYDNISDSWNMLGAVIPTLSAVSVSLSGSGNRLAVGYKTLMKVYDYDIDSDSWEQVGDTIDGFDECCVSGYAGAGVTLSKDGNIVVYPDSFSKFVQPYRYKEEKGVWESLGQALESNRADTPTASITNNGDRIVIGEVAFFEGESYVNVYDLRRGI